MEESWGWGGIKTTTTTVLIAVIIYRPPHSEADDLIRETVPDKRCSIRKRPLTK